MRLRICLAIDSAAPSGVGRHMLVLAAELRERHEVALVCSPRGGGADLLRSAAELGLATDLLDRGLGPYDVTHVHAGVAYEGSRAVQCARAAGARVVVRTEHLPWWVRTQEDAQEHRAALGALDAVICVSEGVAASFREAGVPPGLLRVVRNGVAAVAVEDRRASRSRLGLPLHAPVVVTPARLARQKGHADLLEAARTVLAVQPETVFVWSGTGPLEEDLRAAVEAAGLGRSVRLLPGARPIGELLGAADVVALPSLFEGLPLVALEAMSAGVPVVGTRVCGTDEAVLHGETGMLVPPQHPRALAEALLDLLADPRRRAALGAAGRAEHARSFTPERMAEQTLEVYEGLLAGQGSRTPVPPAPHPARLGPPPVPDLEERRP